ncbi:hypothetical protein GALL_137070 [mine drainage metagenome]|uniref:Uncharacterized protein n=1 Tax=mine drainage metagenome TaxID=410659 RepID=A0A1J5S6W8_9ZZZZ
MKIKRTISATLIMGAIVVMLSACQKEGPAEKAGKAVDNAVDKTGQQIEKAGDKIQDASKGDKK